MPRTLPSARLCEPPAVASTTTASAHRKPSLQTTQAEKVSGSCRPPLSHYSVAYGKDEDGYGVAMELIKAGANIELADAKNNTPLHYAAGRAYHHLLAALDASACLRACAASQVV